MVNKQRLTVGFVFVTCILVIAPIFIGAGCGLFQQSVPKVDLAITAATASSSSLSATIINNGTEAAGSFKVKFLLDDIYVDDPESKSVTVSSLAVGATTTVTATNTLSSSDGKGGHTVSVQADSDSEVAETNEGNNTSSATYYDGDYSDTYTSVLASQGSWITEAKNLALSYFGWAAGDYNMHLLDTVAGTDSGSTASGKSCYRKINGTYTSVTLLNLGSIHEGFSPYIYKGVSYPYNSSQEVVEHEFTHNYHREYAINNGGYNNWLNDVPAWLKEGLAVFTSGQGPDRVKYYVYSLKNYNSKGTEEVVDDILGEVNGTSSDANDYAGNYLAIYYIVYNHGLTALKNIVNDNAGGTAISTAIVNRLSGISSWSAFKSTVRSFSISYVNEYWGDLKSAGASGIKSIKPEVVEARPD